MRLGKVVLSKWVKGKYPEVVAEVLEQLPRSKAAWVEISRWEDETICGECPAFDDLAPGEEVPFYNVVLDMRGDGGWSWWFERSRPAPLKI